MSDSFAYDSFGNVASTTGGFAQPFRFTGREWDTETGLYYYRARYYDPSTGRFINGDPIGFSGGINFYSYAFSNPVNFRDPTGNSAGTIAIPIARGIGTLLCFESGACETAIVIGTAAIGVGAAGYLLYQYISDSTTNDDAQAKKKPSPCKKDPCLALRIQLALHQAKLAQYASNPYANDNLSILGKGYDDRIIAGRVKHLVQEILELQKQLQECERLSGKP